MNKEKGKRIIKKMLFFLEVIFWICIFVTPLCVAYYAWAGQKIEIQDLSEDEIQKIKDTYKTVYNLELDDTDEIVSIAYMARGIDPFFVLKIKTSSPDEFCENNAEQFPEQEKLKTIPFVFSTLSYVPIGGIGGAESIYFSKDYVYISSWAHKSPEVSDVYYEIRNNR